ncbi:polysaccharide deacetylase family protein [Actinomycetospora sp. TBRC 11914]|uniref:polysaccharide deacetylase family protein n=1 Tax=Actinomycetospora sp. TBRC 11914 TaxID=2729387 RepID=UPI00145F061B|nr:polysaccharide deacetylase family protein [Actinomycetospora sp. TBRC 11914]NMO89479.1 polysaccharide deacetylase family protein [Actinomycetospora sp. TBRC 11914]
MRVLLGVTVAVVLTVGLGAASAGVAAPPARAGTGSAPARPRVTPTVLTTTRAPGKVVALTFDDGPTARYTPQILALLARNHVTATFCEIGQQARAQPALVRRVVAGGHRLCDHTITHDPTVGTHTPAVIDQQLRASRDVLATAGKTDVDYFRAPDGNWTPNLVRLSARDGMQPLGWTVDPRDWSRPGTAAIVRTVATHVRPGSVILLHDGGGPRDQTVQAVAQLIPWLRAQGYSFVLPG